MTEKGFKRLNPNGIAPYSLIFQYDLPVEGKPGKWTKSVRQTRFCVTGYHYCTNLRDLLRFRGTMLYECEVIDPTHRDEKSVARRMRITRFLGDQDTLSKELAKAALKQAMPKLPKHYQKMVADFLAGKRPSEKRWSQLSVHLNGVHILSRDDWRRRRYSLNLINPHATETRFDHVQSLLVHTYTRERFVDAFLERHCRRILGVTP